MALLADPEIRPSISCDQKKTSEVPAVNSSMCGNECQGKAGGPGIASTVGRNQNISARIRKLSEELAMGDRE